MQSLQDIVSKSKQKLKLESILTNNLQGSLE